MQLNIDVMGEGYFEENLKAFWSVLLVENINISRTSF